MILFHQCIRRTYGPYGRRSRIQRHSATMQQSTHHTGRLYSHARQRRASACLYIRSKDTYQALSRHSLTSLTLSSRLVQINLPPFSFIHFFIFFFMRAQKLQVAFERNGVFSNISRFLRWDLVKKSCLLFRGNSPRVMPFPQLFFP